MGKERMDRGRMGKEWVRERPQSRRLRQAQAPGQWLRLGLGLGQGLASGQGQRLASGKGQGLFQAQALGQG